MSVQNRNIFVTDKEHEVSIRDHSYKLKEFGFMKTNSKLLTTTKKNIEITKDELLELANMLLREHDNWVEDNTIMTTKELENVYNAFD